MNRINQDGTLLHEKTTPAMIVCEIADSREYGKTDS